MPVVTVTAPALPAAAERAALIDLARAVADALALPDDGVFATAVEARGGVLGSADAVWPLVVLHGGRREDALMDAAIAAAEASVRRSWGAGDVWVQWVLR